MIREFSAKAKPSNNKAKVAFFVLLAIAVALTVVYMVVPLYKGIIGIVIIGIIAAVVLIYTKYIGSVYYYDVTFDYSGAAVFVVRQITGKRQSTLARIALSEIISIEKETAEQRRAHKTPIGHIKYSYLPTLMPSVAYRITSRSRYEKSEILVEITEELAMLLSDYSKEAREFALSEDDE